MDRKQFLKTAALSSCGVALSLAHAEVGAEQSAPAATPAPTPTVPGVAHTCEERVAFAEQWAKRFMDVLDEGVEEPTRVRLMEANGRACFLNWMKKSGTTFQPIAFPAWAEKVRAAGPNEAVTLEGDRAFVFQYTSNTKGAAAPAGFCLCDLMESKPAGVSPTYCNCSVGYVRELFSRRFGQPVKVTLLDSVLRGGTRCRFRVELA